MEMDVDIFANLQPSNQVAGTDIFANMSRTMNPPELTEPASARESAARTSRRELPLHSQRVGGFGLHELTVTAAQVSANLLSAKQCIWTLQQTSCPPVSTFFVPRVLKGGWNYFGQAKPCSVLFVDGSCRRRSFSGQCCPDASRPINPTSTKRARALLSPIQGRGRPGLGLSRLESASQSASPPALEQCRLLATQPCSARE